MRFTTAILLLGTCVLLGCDKDDNTPAVQAVPPSNTTPPPAPPASKPAPITSAPRITNFNDSFHDITGPVKPDKIIAKVIQTLPVFNHPTGCTVSLDGKYLFVTNSAVVVNGVEYNKGSISKLEIGPDGRLKMIDPDFIKGLHAPMGIAPLPKATAAFPAGSLFVTTGMTTGLDDKGQPIDDVTRFNPGVNVFDPATGKSLGFIPMGGKHAIAKALRHPVLDPAGVCFDPLGNLYVADSANTGRDLDPPIIGLPGIFRIMNADLDGYAQDQPQKEAPEYLAVRHLPFAVYYSTADDAIYWTTCDGQPGGGGAVYRIPRADFPAQNMVNSIVGDLGALLGVVITPNGSMIASRIDGDLALLTKKILAQVAFDEDASFSTPADIKLLTLPSGYNILYVPEQEPNSQARGKQRLRVILLPTSL
jgi:DNA-binding beta-propeller fold protein YncE